MTIEFKEEQILQKEKDKRKPFVGYFAPNGDLIDFNILFGGHGHEDWQNIVSQIFLKFVSYAIKRTSVENLKQNDYSKLTREFIGSVEYPGLDEYVIRGLGIYLNFNNDNLNTFLNDLDAHVEYYKPHELSDEYSKFRYQLLLFFKKAYANRNFFETIGRKIEVISEKDFILKNNWLQNRNLREKEMFYREYLRLELMQYFKDIAVMYLCYDSIERFSPNGKPIEITPLNKDIKFNFFQNPRIITSSYPNINERYYNYKLMNWVIHRLPKYNYNEQTKLYEKYNFSTFYQSENEQKLEQEILSIKKLVPLRERWKYFSSSKCCYFLFYKIFICFCHFLIFIFILF